MSENLIIQKLGHSIAQEAQLLAEEKWIIETLNKIKNQRNSLQIERLQLESMKNQQNIETSLTDHLSPHMSDTFSYHMMQNISAQEPEVPVSAEDRLLETEARCNMEELNLTATNSIFTQMPIGNLNMEEYEEEEFDDDEDWDHLLIDMNMFMHGKQNSKSKLL